VPDDQLSLAIGREGQNARLAARLTGWRIDIRSETDFAQDTGDDEFQEESNDGRCHAVLATAGAARTPRSAARTSAAWCPTRRCGGSRRTRSGSSRPSRRTSWPCWPPTTRPRTRWPPSWPAGRGVRAGAGSRRGRVPTRSRPTRPSPSRAAWPTRRWPWRPWRPTRPTTRGGRGRGRRGAGVVASGGHVPHRRCTGCGIIRPQRELLRLALRESGMVVADPLRRLPGRGAYVCDAACLERAARGADCSAPSDVPLRSRQTF
jgi:hypothetical protein